MMVIIISNRIIGANSIVKRPTDYWLVEPCGAPLNLSYYMILATALNAAKKRCWLQDLYEWSYQSRGPGFSLYNLLAPAVIFIRVISSG